MKAHAFVLVQINHSFVYIRLVATCGPWYGGRSKHLVSWSSSQWGAWWRVSRSPQRGQPTWVETCQGCHSNQGAKECPWPGCSSGPGSLGISLINRASTNREEMRFAEAEFIGRNPLQTHSDWLMRAFYFGSTLLHLKTLLPLSIWGSALEMRQS